MTLQPTIDLSPLPLLFLSWYDPSRDFGHNTCLLRLKPPPLWVGRGRVLMTDGSTRSEVTQASPHSCPTQISLTYDLTLDLDSRLGTSGGLPYSTYYTKREEWWKSRQMALYSRVFRSSHFHFRGLHKSDQSVITLLDTTSCSYINFHIFSNAYFGQH